MQRGRTIIVVALFAGLAAMLFPFFTAQTLGDVPGWSGPVWLPLAALVLSAAAAVAGDRGESFTGLSAVAATAAVVAALLLTAAIAIDASLAARDANELGLSAAVGTGLWLTVIASVLAAVGLGVGLSRRLS